MTKRRLLIGIGNYISAAALITGVAFGAPPTASSKPAGGIAEDGTCTANSRSAGACCPIISALSIGVVGVPSGQCSNAGPVGAAQPVGATQLAPQIAPPTGPVGPGPTGPPRVGNPPLGGVTDTVGHVAGGVTGAVGGLN